MGAWLLALALALLTPIAASPPAAHAQDAMTRAKVARRKALFIEQFTRLVDWPATVLPKDGPFVLCILGNSDTGAELTTIASARKFKDRRVDLRRPRPGTDVGSCHVIYVAANEATRLSEVLNVVTGKPILAVSDTPGFVERGVHLNLFEQLRTAPEQGLYVSYELNVTAVKQSVLVFDPQLLGQGRRVHAQAAPDGLPGRPGR
jgi:hypothetical protein